MFLQASLSKRNVLSEAKPSAAHEGVVRVRWYVLLEVDVVTPPCLWTCLGNARACARAAARACAHGENGETRCWSLRV